MTYSPDYPLKTATLTTSDTAITAAAVQTMYYGAVVAAGGTATAVTILTGGSGGTIIDTFEVAANSSEAHMFKVPVVAVNLYANVDANTQDCLVYYQDNE